MFAVLSYIGSVDRSDAANLLLLIIEMFFILAYWVLMPVAFKGRFTAHSFGHFVAFEFAELFPIRNAQFDEMAGLIPYLVFGLYVIVVLIGMIVLAITSTIRKNAEIQNNKSTTEENQKSEL